jgi:hypothetical protein
MGMEKRGKFAIKQKGATEKSKNKRKTIKKKSAGSDPTHLANAPFGWPRKTVVATNLPAAADSPIKGDRFEKPVEKSLVYRSARPALPVQTTICRRGSCW